MKRLLILISCSSLLFSCEIAQSYHQSNIEEAKQYQSTGMSIREGLTLAQLVSKTGIKSIIEWRSCDLEEYINNPNIFGIEIDIDRTQIPDAKYKRFLMRIAANKDLKSFEVVSMDVDGITRPVSTISLVFGVFELENYLQTLHGNKGRGRNYTIGDTTYLRPYVDTNNVIKIVNRHN